MPKLVPIADAEQLAALRTARAEFAAGFARSRKGNLWRTWLGPTVTVFRKSAGGYGWCVAGEGGGTRFSNAAYDLEAEAVAALASAVCIGE